MCACGNDSWSFAPSQEAPGTASRRRVLSSVLAAPLLAPILFRRLPLFQLLGGVVQELGGVSVRQEPAVCTLVRAAAGQLLVAIGQAIRMAVGQRVCAPVGL